MSNMNVISSPHDRAQQLLDRSVSRDEAPGYSFGYAELMHVTKGFRVYDHKMSASGEVSRWPGVDISGFVLDRSFSDGYGPVSPEYAEHVTGSIEDLVRAEGFEDYNEPDLFSGEVV